MVIKNVMDNLLWVPTEQEADRVPLQYQVHCMETWGNLINIGRNYLSI